MSRARPRFSRAAVLEGVRATLPMQIGVVPFALVCGVAALAAMALARLLPGTSWYIIGGALVGSAVGVWRDRMRRGRHGA